MMGPEPKDISAVSFYQKYTNVYLYDNKNDQNIKIKDRKYFIDNQEIDKNYPEFDFNFITF